MELWKFLGGALGNWIEEKANRAFTKAFVRFSKPGRNRGSMKISNEDTYS